MRNKIVLIGNGFDLAHGFETSFTQFADYYIKEKVVPELEHAVGFRRFDDNFFSKQFKDNFERTLSTYQLDHLQQKIAILVREKDSKGLKKFLCSDYKNLNFILNNNLLGKLYLESDKNWFHIENAYFTELIKLKEKAKRNKNSFPYSSLQKLNREFNEIKSEVKEYLKTIEISEKKEIKNFLLENLKYIDNVYVVNFNYTTSFQQYVEHFEDNINIVVNHIHGTLEKDDIIFGYGNDENNDYQEIKDLEIDEFLRHFKTFDYLNNVNYDLIYDDAIDKFQEYEVMVLGHSLGLTDKTLLSEIFNSEKCKKISFYKRSDFNKNPSLTKSTYRELVYSASRIMTNEKILRKRILNYEQSIFFP